VGEKKDLLISFCIALWTTVLLFSMFYMPAIAAELTKEDTETLGNYWWKGWRLEAYVKGYYYEGATTFHHTYHYAEVEANMWYRVSIDKAKMYCVGYLNGEVQYDDEIELILPMYNGVPSPTYRYGEFNYYDTDVIGPFTEAKGWTWARFVGFWGSTWERQTSEAIVTIH